MWVGYKGECAVTHTLVMEVAQGGSSVVSSIVGAPVVSWVGLGLSGGMLGVSLSELSSKSRI